MSSFGDDPIKDLGFVVFPASAGLDQRDCLFLCFLVASLENTKTKSFMLTLRLNMITSLLLMIVHRTTMPVLP